MSINSNQRIKKSSSNSSTLPSSSSSSSNPSLSNDSNQHQNQNQFIHQLEEDHQFGGTHWLPLLFALIPSLGSLIHGDSESWTDSLLLILIGFFLYKLTKVPWQIYASSRTTRILNQIQSNLNPSNLKPNSILHPLPDLTGYTTELQKFESISLFFAIISPSLGVLLLNLIQSRLQTSITLDYLNSNSTILYLLSSLIKPLGHLFQLFLNRTDYLQSKLHFPNDLLTELKTLSFELKEQLQTLESNSISSYELSLLKVNYLETPIQKLTHTLSQQLESDQKRKLQISEECQQLSHTLNQLQIKLTKTKDDLNSLILEQDQLKSNPIHTIAQMIIQLITVSQAEKIEPKVENRFENLDEDDSEEDHDDRIKVNQKKATNHVNHQNDPSDLKKPTAEVEFIRTPNKATRPMPTPANPPTRKIRQWVLYYLTWPILIWIQLLKTMILFPIELISNITKGEEYQRLSERNYQIDKASFMNHQSRPSWFEAQSIHQTLSPLNELSSTFKSQFNLHHRHSHSHPNHNHQNLSVNHLDDIKEVIEEENL